MDIILTRGLPASGKSTWAKSFVEKHPDYVRVCRDDLRFMLGFNWKMDNTNEKYVKELRDRIIDDLVVSGRSVVVDELNLGTKNETYFKQKYPSANMFIKDFTDVHPNTCIERDAKREHSVGKKVILQLWRQFIEPEMQFTQYDDGLRSTCFCIDLDGTWAIIGKRNPYSRDFYNDVVCQPVNKLFHNMLFTVDKAFILSGRSDEFLDETKKWLADKCGVQSHLFNNKIEMFMRSSGDNRPDDKIKQEFVDRIRKDYRIVFAVDDRKQVKRMWNRNGIFVFDVNQYDVEF